ncbi:hypothetical protein J6590_075354 [Homalodisca vitripennis]|nr:hypothetical protein J6590_075354 [Homalodisca vitripennis]
MICPIQQIPSNLHPYRVPSNWLLVFKHCVPQNKETGSVLRPLEQPIIEILTLTTLLFVTSKTDCMNWLYKAYSSDTYVDMSKFLAMNRAYRAARDTVKITPFNRRRSI